VRVRVILTLLAALLLAGCGAEDPEVVPPEPPPAEPPEPLEPLEPPGDELEQRCENEQDGFAVGYPGGWHTNPGDGVPACTFFHPEEFELPEARDVLGELAIHIRREPAAFEDVTGDDPGVEVLEEEQLEIGGRPAVHREIEGTGETLVPQGMRSVQYAVDLGGGETLVAETYDAGQLDFEDNADILEGMVGTLELQP
jgi:hypothetical protein